MLAIAHREGENTVLDRVADQGQRAPFDPRQAVERFAVILREHSCTTVTGDKYAGETFRFDFERRGIRYRVSERTKSQLYESLEPLLNGGRVSLLDVPTLEQELLGLVWRSGKIDHQQGKHDDFANAVAGAVVQVTRNRGTMTAEQIRRCFRMGRGVRVPRPG